MIECNADKWVSSCCNSTVSAIDNSKYTCDDCGGICEKLPWFSNSGTGGKNMIEYLMRWFDSENRRVEE